MTATQLQLRRDTAANIALSTPVAGELWYNTTAKRLHIGDGSSVGGIEIPNYIDIQNGTFDYALATGTANALVVTTAPAAPTAYASGQKIRVKIAADNTGITTINWDSLGVKTIKKWSSGALVDLAGGELLTGMIVTLDYDGTYFVLISGAGGGMVVSRQVFTASGTWTKPAGLLYADVEVIGGGGGGGGTSGSTAASAGGTSSFGAFCSATGGGAGGGYHIATASTYKASGAGGAGSGGDINISGEAGGIVLMGAGSVLNAGRGGASFLGGGAIPPFNASGAGGAGTGYGSGGSGGAATPAMGSGGGGGGYARELIANTLLASSETVTIGAGGSSGTGGSNRGGAGSAGIVIVTEYRSA